MNGQERRKKPRRRGNVNGQRSMQELPSFSKRIEDEQEFKITGVNLYKLGLEAKIERMQKRVKEAERRNHYAEVNERRLEKEHVAQATFKVHDEKDRGMGVLRQLEHLRARIE